jgi:hypothetical protein
MALLFMDGFEGRDPQLKYNYASPSYGGYGGGASSYWGGGRFTGTSYGGMNYASQGPPYMTKFVTPSNVLTMGVAIYNTNPTGLTVNLLRFFGDSGGTLHITVQFTGGLINVLRGGTVIGTSSAGLIPANSWGFVEVQSKIDSSTGFVTVKYNMNTVISFSGNTKNGGTATTVDTAQMYFDGGAVIYVDDVYILNDTGSAPHNTFLGDVRVQVLQPNGAGSSTQLTPSSGANYTTVDELPYSEADYVSGSTSGLRDLYTLTDIGTVNNIYGVQTNVVARKTDSSPISVRNVLRSGGANFVGSSNSLTASSLTFIDLRANDPATSTAWTQASINALEAGFEIV